MTARPLARRRGAQGGFTLIEVLLAIAILVFVTMIMWSSFSQAIVTKRAVEAAQDRAHGVRVALGRMARELELAFLSDSENTAITDRRTMFEGKPHGDIDELQFSAFAHLRLRSGAAESDTSTIKYYGERPGSGRQALALMRRESRRLSASDPNGVPAESWVLCPDVRRLKFTYYDPKLKEWKEEWSTSGASGLTYLPTRVHIELTVIDERGRDVTYSTEARIHMSERVAYRPVRA